MITFEKSGSFIPAALYEQLVVAGVPCLGVTATDDDTGATVAVQIICTDGTDEATVDPVCAAYTPPPSPPTVATADDHAIASAVLITAQLASADIQRNQIQGILQTLLGEAASAIPFFEKYALDPSMTSPQWTAFQALDQTTKDRLLYDTIRSLAALMRYLTGDLPA